MKALCLYFIVLFVYKISQNEIWKFSRNLLLAKFGSERVNFILNMRSGFEFNVTGSLDLEFHYFSLYQEIYYFSIILLQIFLRLGTSRFDLASLCIA